MSFMLKKQNTFISETNFEWLLLGNIPTSLITGRGSDSDLIIFCIVNIILIFLLKLFLQGVDSTIRIEVWKFLLDYYSWDSTYRMRTDQRKKKV